MESKRRSNENWLALQKTIRIRKLHRFSPKSQFKNKIFNLKTHFEIVFFVQFEIVLEQFWSIFEHCYADRVEICESTFMIFA